MTHIDSEKQLVEVHEDQFGYPEHSMGSNGIWTKNEASISTDLSIDKLAVERRLVWKLDLTIAPLLSIMYLFAFLDRGNIGNARLGSFEADLNLTGNRFYNSLSMFFVGYVLFQIPSSIAVKLFSPARWLGLAAIAWGACSTSMAALQSYSGLMAVRFFLGCFEAGLAPCIPLILSFWYKREEIASRVSVYFGSSTIAGAFGGLLAWTVIGHMDGLQGLASWRWLFIVEGLPTVAIGIFCLLFMPNYPETASKYFLTPEEREVAIERSYANHNRDEKRFSKHQLIASMTDFKNWLLGVSFCGLNVCISSYSIFLPTIIRAMGFDMVKSQLLTIPPYVAGCLVLFAVAGYSDRMQQRGFPFVMTCVVGVAGYIFLLVGESFGMKYAGAVLVACGVFPGIPLILSWITNNNVGHTKRGVAIGMTNAMAQCFSILGTQIYKDQDGPRYLKGHAICMGFLTVSGIVALALRIYLVKENKRRDNLPLDAKIEIEANDAVDKLYDNHPSFRYFV